MIRLDDDIAAWIAVFILVLIVIAVFSYIGYQDWYELKQELPP